MVAGFKTESPPHQKRDENKEAGVLLPRQAGRRKLRPRATTQPIPVGICKGKLNHGYGSIAHRGFYHAAMVENDG